MGSCGSQPSAPPRGSAGAGRASSPPKSPPRQSAAVTKRFVASQIASPQSSPPPEAEVGRQLGDSPHNNARPPSASGSGRENFSGRDGSVYEMPPAGSERGRAASRHQSLRHGADSEPEKLAQPGHVEFRVPGQLPTEHNPGAQIAVYASEGLMQWSVNGAPRPRAPRVSVVMRRSLGVALFFDQLEDQKPRIVWWRRNVFLPTSRQQQERIVRAVGHACESVGLEGSVERLLNELALAHEAPPPLSPSHRKGSPDGQHLSVPEDGSLGAPALQPNGHPQAASASDAGLSAEPASSQRPDLAAESAPSDTGAHARDPDAPPAFRAACFPTGVATATVASVLKIMTHYNGGGREGESIHQWQRRFGVSDWTDISQGTATTDVESGSHWAYCPTLDDAGAHLRVTATPVRSDGVRGRPVVTRSLQCKLSPQLCVAVVQQLVEASPGVPVNIQEVRGGVAAEESHCLILQLIERRIKVKPFEETTFPFAAGDFTPEHRIRCHLDPTECGSFILHGLVRPDNGRNVTLRVSVPPQRRGSATTDDHVASQRAQRELVVCLIRVWAACSDADLAGEFLPPAFIRAWQEGLRKIPRERPGRAGDQRADLVWRAFEAPLQGFGLDAAPASARAEAHQAIGCVRTAFANGLARRPATHVGGPASQSPPKSPLTRREDLLRQYGGGRPGT
eukprot:TRINITY_DN14069_c0_g1_i1.p1 TRINITY_DN14069_c0_g1~~TRINITY_DN14069_c0_g1_i1.p1  ORF type:complete len:709 (+),score=93.64 TRINITY_DN14069_c0_g1_i1:88-2127(+)